MNRTIQLLSKFLSQQNIQQCVLLFLGFVGKNRKMGNWLDLFYLNNYKLVKSYVIVGTGISEV